jgi:transposase
MARPRTIDKGLVAKARHVVTHATDLDQLRAAQAVLLPAVAAATLEQTATILGVGRATVPRLQQRFRESVRPRATRPRWGGRRTALLSVEEEAAFLAPWAAQAKEAGLLVLSGLHPKKWTPTFEVFTIANGGVRCKGFRSGGIRLSSGPRR